MLLYLITPTVINEDSTYSPRVKHANESYAKNVQGIAGAMDYYAERRSDPCRLPQQHPVQADRRALCRLMGPYPALVLLPHQRHPLALVSSSAVAPGLDPAPV